VNGPTYAEWLEWRAALPAVDTWPDLAAVGGKTKAKMRAILTEVQSGLCAMCLQPSSALALDHDHFTGLVRGMLDRSCNVTEGHVFGTETELVKLYRANPPAFGAGWIWDSCGYAAKVMLERARAKGKYTIRGVVDADLATMSADTIAELDRASRPDREYIIAQGRARTWAAPPGRR
jgi:Recombination endonuclease VII